MNKSKRGSAVYWVSLLIYAVALAVVIFLVVGMLRSYANEYEASQPDKVIKDYIDQLNENHWNDSMKQAADLLANDFQSAEECEELVKSTLNGEIKYSKAPGAGNIDTEKFNLGCDGQLIGNFSITQDKSREGSLSYEGGIYIPGVGINMPSTNLPWILLGDDFDFSYLKNGESDFTIPSSWTAKINGADVDEKYIVESGIHYDVLDPYYGEFKDLPTKNKYHIDGLIGGLEPEFFDANGNPAVIDDSKDDSQFMEPCSEETSTKLKAFADNFVEAYYDYFGTKNSNMTYPTLLKYVKDPSDLKSRMDQALGDRNWIHTFNNQYSNKSFDGAYSLGGGFYVINYSLDISEYSDYWTAAEHTELKIIVVEEPSSEYGFLATGTE